MTPPYKLHFGDCIDNMRAMPDNSVDSIVTDPPYELGFMGKAWDASGIANNVTMWREALRVLKPGGHMLAFSGSRTYHRMACAIEDAGFDIRDQIFWVYGSGFPKSHSVHKAIVPMVESRYGKETKCDCLDCGNGRLAGNDGGRASGEDVRVQRVTRQSQAEVSEYSGVQNNGGSGEFDVCELRVVDDTESPRRAPVENSVLLAPMCVSGSEASGFGNAKIRAGVEKPAGGGSGAGQDVPVLRQDARGEWCGAACASPETVQSGRDEPPLESRGAVRSMPSPDRGCNGSSFTVDSNRREPRRVVPDDQCGWSSTVAHVCTWCGRPDQPWLDSLRPLGTALKPSHEPICVARKPLIGTVAANVLAHGTGALNIDGCRVGEGSGKPAPEYVPNHGNAVFGAGMGGGAWNDSVGRWPANLIHDGNVPFPAAKGQQGALTGDEPSARAGAADQVCYGTMDRRHASEPRRENDKTAARFFYCAKASKADREDGNTHPTVKPTDLMAYLCRLVTPPGGIVLDPFMGSGSTGKACMREGFRFIGIDMTPEYLMIAAARIGAEWKARTA